MPRQPRPDEKNLSVHVTKDLHRALVQAARQDGRSLQREVEFLLALGIGEREAALHPQEAVV